MKKTIVLEKTDLGDFRGRTGRFEFSPGINKFSGMNGTGKTTLFDAHTWIFFGKNSLGKEKFNIKSLVDGKPVSGSEHSVDSIYNVNGENHRFGRFYSEKWTKARGAMNAVKTGNTTVYKVDTKKCPKKDYDKVVNELLQPTGFDQALLDKDITPTEIYKIVTDPKYFPSLPWLTMRKILGHQGFIIPSLSIIHSPPS